LYEEEGMRVQCEGNGYGADLKRLTDTQAMFGLGSLAWILVSVMVIGPTASQAKPRVVFDDGKLRYTKNAAYRIKLKDNRIQSWNDDLYRRSCERSVSSREY
jgi:hypothetical protein